MWPYGHIVVLISWVLGPLDAKACRGLVTFLHMELHAFAAVTVTGTDLAGTDAILFDVYHAEKIAVMD